MGGIGSYGWDRETLVGQGEAKRQSAKVKTKWANLALAAWIGFENATLTLGFISGREGCLGSERVFDN